MKGGLRIDHAVGVKGIHISTFSAISLSHGLLARNGAASPRRLNKHYRSHLDTIIHRKMANNMKIARPLM